MTQDQLEASAQLSALTFLTEVLLANFIASKSKADGDGFIADLRRVSQKTDDLIAEDEHHAADISDVAIETQRRIGHILDRAIERIGSR